MISIVTVNYKSVDYLEKMLSSLFAFVPNELFEVIVVENASGDDLSAIQAQFPSVKIIRSEKNLGFAAGCNLAIKHTSGTDILLVNPDVIFIEDAITPLLAHLQSDAQVGIAGGALMNLDGSHQASVRRLPTPKDQLVLLLKLHHVFPGLLDSWYMRGFDYSKSTDVEQVMGAFFFIRRELLEEIGVLDESFFIWYEEVDYCARAKAVGWKVRYYADVRLQHKGGGSFDRVQTREKQKIVRASSRRYIEKHFGRTYGRLFRFLEPFFRLASGMASLLKPR